MTDVGHNSSAPLKSIVERINRLEDEKKVVSENISDVYAEAKSAGYNPKAIRVVIKRQRADEKKLAALEADTEAYMTALGMF